MVPVHSEEEFPSHNKNISFSGLRYVDLLFD